MDLGLLGLPRSRRTKCLLQFASPKMAHRDLLRRRAVVVAIGVEADITCRLSSMTLVENDPEADTGPL